ncbi:MAG: bifunctional [glutamine synthetase] adenylyltransferase/[glutamine synthetase]-adenylyl-L-tyrosine phosphorylase [Alphaproteobacteria bacterium]|nr:bifunctional [glutamine synthetase] adenylyltransferase/[glutamine synthetase]-adenylyl-L-tyrosine phosphorylase [Alphaproteobacteria bacterium]
MSAGPTLAAELTNKLPPGVADPELDGLVEAIIQKDTPPEVGRFLGAIFARSPYLRQMAGANIGWLHEALASPLEEINAALLGEVDQAGKGDDEATLAIALRKSKSKMALLAALAECGGAWSTRQSSAALSRFADGCLDGGLNVLFRGAAARGKIEIPATGAPAARSGLMIFALGKLGGCELNYSSDIDIVAFYEPGRGALKNPDEAGRFYVRIVRKLAALIGDQTEHGFVFRTDLRLRPDPGSTPVAISADAAMVYYESRGQNWERAAWIRARAAAGDKEAGENFLKQLAPFIWRKHLDFATVADIRAMKRQISARHGATTTVAGHNVKLGAGGIREIEFFAQTQQLIAGGRDPSLRDRPTVDALRALAGAGMFDPETGEKLGRHYWFLRAVENRLQMIENEQTHILPEQEPALANIAALMGHGDSAGFSHVYRGVADETVQLCQSLFYGDESLASDFGDLVFTGADHDPETLKTLERFGFSDPETASNTIRGWQYGAYPATRTDRARQNLTELVPTLLSALADTGDADQALRKFDIFLSRLPAGIQLFAMLRAHGSLVQIFVDLLATAPRLTDAIGHKVHVIDALIDTAFYGGALDRDELADRIDEEYLGENNSYEDLIDRARIVGHEQMFLVSAGLVAATIPPEQAGPRFAAIAEILLHRLSCAAKKEFAKRHGALKGASDGLLAFGKLASFEMTASSDLDFILLYDGPADVEQSDGPRPLTPGHYYTRLTQRLVAAVSAPTAEGVLYETDMRLRPSGNKGPLATSLESFVRYQRTEARTWEHMALARARVMDMDGGLGPEISASIDQILGQPRNRDRTMGDIAKMRALIAKQKPPRSRFDLKLVSGGLIDLEFIAQAGQLVFRSGLENPHAPPAGILVQLGRAGVLKDGDRLAEIHGTYTTMAQLMNACLLAPYDISGWTPGFRALLVRVTKYPDFSAIEADLEQMAGEVRGAFGRFTGQ